MGGFIDLNGNYYEGERFTFDDIEVNSRPTEYHKYSTKLKQWIVDDEAVENLKAKLLNQLDEELRTKTIILNMTSEEKEALKKKYEEKLKLLSIENDPIILQESINLH